MPFIQLGLEQVSQAQDVLAPKRLDNLVFYGHLESSRTEADLKRRTFFADSWPEFSTILCLAAISPKVNVLKEGIGASICVPVYTRDNDTAQQMMRECVVEAGYMHVVFVGLSSELSSRANSLLYNSGYKSNFEAWCKTYTWSPGAADDLMSPPSGYVFRPLAARDIPTVNSLYKFAGSQDMRESMEHVVTNHLSLGAFYQDELIGFFVESDHGPLQALTVQPDHGRRGVGSYLEAQLARMFRQRYDRDPFIIVLEDNIGGQKTSMKAGFRVIELPPCVFKVYFHGETPVTHDQSV